MKSKNREKTEYWMKALWTGQVYGTRNRMKHAGAPRAALRRFQQACTTTLEAKP
jgi:hypothetical protein